MQASVFKGWNQAWIGLYNPNLKVPPPGAWEWLDGYQDTSDLFWLPGQPNNAGESWWWWGR